MDFDSTVQEGNIADPADMSMMQSLLRKTTKVLDILISKDFRKANKLNCLLQLMKKNRTYYSRCTATAEADQALYRYRGSCERKDTISSQQKS